MVNLDCILEVVRENGAVQEKVVFFDQVLTYIDKIVTL